MSANPSYVCKPENPAGENGKNAEKPILTAIRKSTRAGSALDEVTLPDRARIIGEWFREGDYGILFGYRGLGKSWMGLGLSVAITTKGRFGPFESLVEWPVLYIDGEMVLSDLRDKRIRALNGGSCPEKLHVLNHELLFAEGQATLNLGRFDDQEAILTICQEKGIRVLTLDNLSSLVAGIEENDADSWEGIKSWFLKLRRLQIAVLLIHHSGRDGKHLRGTSKREDDAFWIMRLEDPGEEKEIRGAHFISRFQKNRNAPADPLSFEWKIEENPNGKPKITTKHVSSDETIVQWVRDGLTSASEIADEMGLTKGSVSKRASRLIEAGRLEKNGRGYKLGPLE